MEVEGTRNVEQHCYLIRIPSRRLADRTGEKRLCDVDSAREPRMVSRVCPMSPDCPPGSFATSASHHVLHPTAEVRMHYLVIDDRFGTPIYVLLETDPRLERGFPTLPVREITLERWVSSTASSSHTSRSIASVGRDPAHLDQFREFGSDWAVAQARFILIEPRYVGPSWPSYLSAFRPEGEKPMKLRPVTPMQRQVPSPPLRPSSKGDHPD